MTLREITLKDAVNEALTAGFKLANKRTMPGVLSGPAADLRAQRGVDPYAPDVLLANDEGIVLPMFGADMDEPVTDGQVLIFAHMTLGEDTTPAQLAALEQAGGFFFTLEASDQHVGYVPLDAKEPLEIQLVTLKAMGLDHQPYAFDRDALSLLPMFGREGERPMDLSDEQLAHRVAQVFAEQAEAVAVPPELQYFNDGQRLVPMRELEVEPSPGYPSTPRPGQRLGMAG